MGFGKRKTATSIKVGFIETPARQIIIKRELPFGQLTCASEHALTDADKQLELFKWIYDPMYPKYREWTLMGFLIKNAELGERRMDKIEGSRKIRFFDKEKLKSELYSQKVMSEAVMRRKRRAPSVQAADGMLWRDTFPIHFLQKGSGIIVVNGVWPDEIT
jgi:hypothetical protein